MIEPPTSN